MARSALQSSSLSRAQLLGGTVAATAASAAYLLLKRRSKAKRPTVVVLGLGYCGSAIARRLAADGLTALGTTRGEADPGNIRAGVQTLTTAAGETPEVLLSALRCASVVVATAPPGEAGDPFLASAAIKGALAVAIQRGALVIYLSSVGVYGDQQGRDVTEETPPAPRTARAKRRLAAEGEWRALGACHLAIVRLPGIYGPFRGPLAKAGEGNTLIVKEGHLFSRIHIDDVANTCSVLVERRRSASEAEFWKEGQAFVLNCCDSEPAPQHEVATMAYKLLGRPVPPATPFESAELSAMQRSFYEESRRMDNTRLVAILGDLRYPSYRTGLPASLEAERRVKTSSSSALATLLSGGVRCAVALPWTLLAPTAREVRVAIVDNGSLQPEATFSLRRIAASVEAEARRKGHLVRVEAAAARFADRIPARELGGKPAEVVPGWLKRVGKESRHGQKVILLPLLIGPANTLTKSLPEAGRAAPDGLEISIAPSLVCLCPALYSLEASGASQVAEMVADSLATISRKERPPGANGGATAQTTASSNSNRSTKHMAAWSWCGENDFIFLCDHGSPSQRVTAAREAVRVALEKRLELTIRCCCMERRAGPEFDFNGSLLEDALKQLPQGARCAVALLFLQEGRHAGPGGDIATIIVDVCKERPDISVVTTKVLAGHPGLIDLLLERLNKAIPLHLFS